MKIYLADLNPVKGSELGKERPVLIIQNDIGNKYSPTVIIVPITSVKNDTKPLPIFVYLNIDEAGLDKESIVDCAQIRTIDKQERIKTKIGELSQERMLEVNKALLKSLGLI